jgi:hypothetical protein
MQLTLRVRYDAEETPSEPDCYKLLKDIVEHAAGEGLLSGDSDLIVDDFRYNIETVEVTQ